MTMRRTSAALVALVALTLAAAGCSSRVDESEGGVLLSVSDFDGLPTVVSVNALGFPPLLVIEDITIDNIPKDPAGNTSALMNVEMQSYEVVFTRIDTGTRVPTPKVAAIFGVAPVGGNIVYENLPLMTSEQLRNPPLEDLLVVNGGIDSETGARSIALELRVTFFGRTLTGHNVATAPIRFDIEFVP
ncbi:MAG TPA: hypothetical protein VMQ81_09060 [Acidimicrobiia bacterium]|nr:hypothetical protein [Acidimicrobiia bacterium]